MAQITTEASSELWVVLKPESQARVDVTVESNVSSQHTEITAAFFTRHSPMQFRTLVIQHKQKATNGQGEAKGKEVHVLSAYHAKPLRIGNSNHTGR